MYKTCSYIVCICTLYMYKYVQNKSMLPIIFIYVKWLLNIKYLHNLYSKCKIHIIYSRYQGINILIFFILSSKILVISSFDFTFLNLIFFKYSGLSVNRNSANRLTSKPGAGDLAGCLSPIKGVYWYLPTTHQSHGCHELRVYCIMFFTYHILTCLTSLAHPLSMSETYHE